MLGEIAEKLREYITEAETAADCAKEALHALEDGDAAQAATIFGRSQELDGYRAAILRVLTGDSPPSLPFSGTTAVETL